MSEIGEMRHLIHCGDLDAYRARNPVRAIHLPCRDARPRIRRNIGARPELIGTGRPRRNHSDGEPCWNLEQGQLLRHQMLKRDLGTKLAASYRVPLPARSIGQKQERIYVSECRIRRSY